MGVAAFVLGIIALLMSVIPLLGMGAFVLAVPAIIFGIIPLVRKKPKGLAIAGIVLAVIAILIGKAQFNAVDDAIGEGNQINSSSNSKSNKLEITKVYYYAMRKDAIVVEVQNFSKNPVKRFNATVIFDNIMDSISFRYPYLQTDVTQKPLPFKLIDQAIQPGEKVYFLIGAVDWDAREGYSMGYRVAGLPDLELGESTIMVSGNTPEECYLNLGKVFNGETPDKPTQEHLDALFTEVKGKCSFKIRNVE